MRQKGTKKLTGKIVVKTGLHIGAGTDKIEIGGMDNPFIKNPLKNNEPYIPGSSLKGKMRALLEWKEHKVLSSGKPHECANPECIICRIFGCGNTDEEKARLRGPTRIIIRDAELSDESRKKSDEGKPLLEDKTENTLNRITAAANPRHIERVLPGTKFDFELIYRIIDTNDGGSLDENMFKSVVLGTPEKPGILQLLVNDYLGGGGTRGNGRIEFRDLELADDNGNNERLQDIV